jgi:hypothetical protein
VEITRVVVFSLGRFRNRDCPFLNSVQSFDLKKLQTAPELGGCLVPKPQSTSLEEERKSPLELSTNEMNTVSKYKTRTKAAMMHALVNSERSGIDPHGNKYNLCLQIARGLMEGKEERAY